MVYVQCLKVRTLPTDDALKQEGELSYSLTVHRYLLREVGTTNNSVG